MNKGNITDLWGYGCAVIRNARAAIERRNKVVRTHNISLEAIKDSAAWQKPLSYRARALHRIKRCCVLHIMGEEIVLYDEKLARALSQLDYQRLRIVLLYYGLEMTDEEIRSILRMKHRSLVQYHRCRAIEQLQEWMGEMEEDYEEL